MQTCNPRPLLIDGLLDCRSATLGIDLSAIEGRGEMIETIKRRCMSCTIRGRCELDLKRDPNDPVWETYCPNTAALIGLAQS
jgi:hypothetical protein